MNPGVEPGVEPGAATSRKVARVFLMMRDPFFLLSLAGALLGVAGAIGTRRFARRTRPLAFRRHRRHVVPLLLIPVVILCGLAFLSGAGELLTWWRWSVIMPAVAAALIWIATGVPGRLAVLPVRVILILVLAALPLSGALFRTPGEIQAGDAVLLHVSRAGESTPDHLLVAVDEGQVLQVAATERLIVEITLVRAIAPLWWMPPAGTVREVTVRGITAAGETSGWITATATPILTELRDPLERFMSASGLIRIESLSVPVPGQRGFFLQPGEYRVSLDG